MTTYENPCEIFEGGIFAPKIKQKETEVMKSMEKTTMSVQELSAQMGISLQHCSPKGELHKCKQLYCACA